MSLNSKIKWTLIVCFIFVIGLLSQSVHATRYYVSNGTVGGVTGNDANRGDSTAPWLTMRKACQTLVAGDTVLIRSGRYDETSARSGDMGSVGEFGLSPVNNGTPGHPIVFKGYPGDVRPIHIGKGNNSGTGFRGAAYLVGSQYITFDSIEFRFGYRGIQPAGGATDIIVRNCIIDSTVGPTNNNNGGFVAFNTSFGGIRRCIVENSEMFHNGDQTGYIAGNTSGIHIYVCDSCVFRNNIIHDQTAGIHIKGELCDSTKWIEIYGNKVYNTTEGAYWVGHTGMQKDITIRNNVAYNIAGSGFTGAGVILNMGGTSCPQAWDLRRIKIYNNTFDCGGTSSGIRSQFGHPADSIDIFNNIFYNPTLNTADYQAALGFKEYNLSNGAIEYGTNLYEDYNLYYGRSDGVYFIYPTTTNYTLSSWRSASPTGVLAGHGLHDTIADPQFTSRIDHIYTLKDSSAARTGGKGGIYPTYRGAFPPAGLTVTLMAKPACLPPGGGTDTLIWISTNADSVVIRDQANQRLTGSGPTNGTIWPTVTTATTYVATAYKSPNTATSTAPVTVGCVLQPTVTLTAKPTSFSSGGGTDTLTWTSTNADSVVISDQNNTRIAGGLQANGSTTTSLTSTTIYTATAYKMPNTATAQVTVIVSISTSTDITAPAPVASLIISRDSTFDPTHRNITLRWTAPGDDGDTGTATVYDLRFDTLLITNDAGFNVAAQVAGEPSPHLAGSVDSMTISGLNPLQVYFFALKTADEVPNWSPMSNVAGSQNRALGRLAAVSGTYLGYTEAPLTNGVIAPRSTATTWSSDQSPQPHWVEVDFGAARPINSIKSYWAWNNARSAWMVSQQYTIQRWNGSAYVDIATVNNPTATDSLTVTLFPTVSTQRARIYQPANMGPVTYPTIMWLTELKIEYDTIPPPNVNDLSIVP